VKRFFVQLSYDGTHYHGWQIQPNALSVQEVIEENLSKLIGEKTTVVGCGRTDTGVHASDYFLHFDCETLKYTVDEMCFKLNNMLPQDISIKKVFEVAPNAHARFDATSREYRYFIHQAKNPFMNPYSWFISREINTKVMQGKMQEVYYCSTRILLPFPNYTQTIKPIFVIFFLSKLPLNPML
jgi:tRNA pseudouridine38-40 synthase